MRMNDLEDVISNIKVIDFMIERNCKLFVIRVIQTVIIVVEPKIFEQLRANNL